MSRRVAVPLTLRSLFEILDGEAAPDPEFADDLEAIQHGQPLAGAPQSETLPKRFGYFSTKPALPTSRRTK